MLHAYLMQPTRWAPALLQSIGQHRLALQLITNARAVGRCVQPLALGLVDFGQVSGWRLGLGYIMHNFRWDADAR